MYKIMFYGGMAGTIFMLVITVFIFIKGNVLEDIKDLLGIKSTKIKLALIVTLVILKLLQPMKFQNLWI